MAGLLKPEAARVLIKTLKPEVGLPIHLHTHDTAFETDTRPATADLYRHEMPGGQYTTLFQQARALGLDDQWPEICRTCATKDI